MEVGFFGKLPGLGDFLQRNVAPELVQAVENWIYPGFEAAIAATGSSWQQHYFKSPIWRFMLPAGLWHHQAVTGFMMPSIDKASRCFPFIVICQASSEVDPLLWSMQLDTQHRQAEDFAISLLEVADPDLVSLLSCLTHFYPNDFELQSQPTVLNNSNRSVSTLRAELAGGGLMASHFAALNHAYAQQLCCWWTAGGPDNPPELHYSQGLPQPELFKLLFCNETSECTINGEA